MMPLIYISLFCAGLFIVANANGMLLVPAVNLISRYIPEWARKPLFECLPCMASFWTVVFATICGTITWWLPVQICIVCGMNSIISAILKPMFDEEE